MKLPRIDIRWNYVFFCYSIPFVHKSGISEDVGERRRQIQYDLRRAYEEPDLVLRKAIALPSIIAATQEARIHRILAKCMLRYRGIPKSVSGYSEFFWYINPITAACLYFILRNYGADVTPCHIALFALIPVYPADAALLVFAVFVVEIMLFLGGVMLAGFIVFNIYQYIQS